MQLTGRVNGELVTYKIQDKSSSKLMILISYFLFWQRSSFLRNYYTTIGNTVYCPKMPPSREVIEHELIHVYDYQKSPIWFTLSYILLFNMRAHWERRAYSWNIVSHNWTSYEFYKRQFCSSTYLWMWPFPKKVQQWVDDCKSGKYKPIHEVKVTL